MISCLEQNKNLQILVLAASPSVIFKKSLEGTLKFELCKLSVALVFVPDLVNFFNFLTSQAASLQELSIQVATNSRFVLEFTVNNLPNLVKLEIHCTGVLKETPDLPEELKLKVNSSIKEILIEKIKLQNISSLKVLLVALPKLESLTVTDASKETFFFVLQNAKKLKKFQTIRHQVTLFDV